MRKARTSKTGGANNRNGNKSSALGRALQILSAFTHDRPELTMSEITQDLNIPKATAFRMLVTMAEHDIIEYNSAIDTYRLGPNVLGVADVVLKQSKIRTTAYSEMLRLQDKINQTIVLSIRVGREYVDFDQVESSHAIQYPIELGVKKPLFLDATGLCILAGLPSKELESFFRVEDLSSELKNVNVVSIVLQQKLASIRRRGYESQDLSGGATVIAAPIIDQTHAVQAALSVPIPLSRTNEAVKAAVIAQLLTTVGVISGKLAHRPFGHEP